MDTNLTLELFIGRGMIDKSLAKDIKEEMTVSGKELPEVLADFGIIGSKDDIWQMIASDLGTEFITLDNFQPDPNVQNMMPATLVRLHGALPVRHGPEGLYVCLVDPLNILVSMDIGNLSSSLRITRFPNASTNCTAGNPPP